MLINIGMIVKEYENSTITTNNNNGNLLKAKEVCEKYPAITPYGLNEAVKQRKIPIVKIGKLNFYDPIDIEKYINNKKTYVSEVQENNSSNNSKKYV